MPESIPSRSEEISLREHLESLIRSETGSLKQAIEGVRREVLLIQTAAQTAVEKTERTVDKRMADHNDLLNKMLQQERNYATKEVVTNIEQRLTRVETKGANLDGRLWAIGAIITVLNTLIALAPLVLNK